MDKSVSKWITGLVLLGALSLISACGSGGGGGNNQQPTYRVGGVVSGLAGNGLILQNKSGDDLHITTNGSFTFITQLSTGATYSVTVKTHPSSPNQVCTASNNTGSILTSNISDVSIVCSTITYSVGGVVSGLTGSLVLQNNGADNITLLSNGSFTFSTQIADSGGYMVSVLNHPTDQECLVTSGTGTVSGGNISTISIACGLDTRKFVYIANTNENTVSILFSGSTISTVKKIAVGAGPNDIAVDNAKKKVYVACKNSDILSVIDMLSSSVVDTIPVGARPEGVAINTNDNTIYVSNWNDATVSVITTSGSYSIVKNISVGGSPDYIHINPTTNRAYVSNYGSGTVSVIDTVSRTNVATISGVGGGTTGNAIDAVKERLYVVSSMGGSVSIVSTVTNSILSTITVGGAGAGGIALNIATNRAYVTDGSSGLHVLDTTLGSEKELSTINVGSAACANAFHAIVDRVYVANCFGDSVSVIDTLTETVIDTITVGAFPSGVGVP